MGNTLENCVANNKLVCIVAFEKLSAINQELLLLLENYVPAGELLVLAFFSAAGLSFPMTFTSWLILRFVAFKHQCRVHIKAVQTTYLFSKIKGTGDCDCTEHL